MQALHLKNMNRHNTIRNIGTRQSVNGITVFHPEESELGMIYLNPDSEPDEIFFIPKENFKEGTATSADGYTFREMKDMANGIFSEESGLDFDIVVSMVYEIISRCTVRTMNETINDEEAWCDFLKSRFYTKDTEVFWQDPAFDEYDDSENTDELTYNMMKVIKFISPDMILIGEAGREAEVPLRELYRPAGIHCPQCNRTLFHEKYLNTESEYPFVCLNEDENFFSFEIVE